MNSPIIQIQALSNDVVPRLRTLHETDIRTIVRAKAVPLLLLLYHPIQCGEAQSNPIKYISRAIADNHDLQRSIVSHGSHMTAAEIDWLEPPALLQACIEVIEFMRCVTSDERLAEIVLDELRSFMPGLSEELL